MAWMMTPEFGWRPDAKPGEPALAPMGWPPPDNWEERMPQHMKDYLAEIKNKPLGRTLEPHEYPCDPLPYPHEPPREGETWMFEPELPPYPEQPDNDLTVEQIREIIAPFQGEYTIDVAKSGGDAGMKNVLEAMGNDLEDPDDPIMCASIVEIVAVSCGKLSEFAMKKAVSWENGIIVFQHTSWYNGRVQKSYYEMNGPNQIVKRCLVYEKDSTTQVVATAKRVFNRNAKTAQEEWDELVEEKGLRDAVRSVTTDYGPNAEWRKKAAETYEEDLAAAKVRWARWDARKARQLEERKKLAWEQWNAKKAAEAAAQAVNSSGQADLD